ncbi:MAG: T9SS type A sorting domain-containing protein [Lentimicrobium sp.]|jgi:hypothetical protein|uniref:T9SS type A sorting domain-containing protein n=1 Tax=Lentimicrobium sp. TaxID=2034841 RepID=UPI0025E100D3|nr:T9SS type A sorting domain-containing protein [Lentimicrobium sp.]MCO5257571.1 T9SS type A sorting domain-containing protein [Lentimicrobium sp.]
MKSKFQKAGFILALVMFLSLPGFTQLNGFVLNPSGTTSDFMKYIPRIEQYNGTNYVTGYLTLSAFQVQLGNMYDPGMPVQKLQLQGGNILLCKSFNQSYSPAFNPTSKNGAILFSDNVTNTHRHGKWGIEYDNVFSAGGLNFFNPVSQLTDERINFNLFLSNSGNVGIGSGEPVAKLQVKDGDIFIEDINRGIIMKSPDGSCWRGVLNNQGQLEFTLLPDCAGTLVSSRNIDSAPGFRISPNPASGYVHFTCTEGDLNRFDTYKMIDASGKEVKSGIIRQASEQISTRDLKSGMYFLNFHGNNAFWTEKLIIQ